MQQLSDADFIWELRPIGRPELLYSARLPTVTAIGTIRVNKAREVVHPLSTVFRVCLGYVGRFRFCICIECSDLTLGVHFWRTK